MSGLNDVLDDLIAGKWILTLEDAPNGTSRVVAHRPVGWSGPGDPHERIVADDHVRLLRCLVERRDASANAPKESDDSGPTMRGIGRDLPTLGWAIGD